MRKSTRRDWRKNSSEASRKKELRARDRENEASAEIGGKEGNSHQLRTSMVRITRSQQRLTNMVEALRISQARIEDTLDNIMNHLISPPPPPHRDDCSPVPSPSIAVSCETLPSSQKGCRNGHASPSSPASEHLPLRGATSEETPYPNDSAVVSHSILRKEGQSEEDKPGPEKGQRSIRSDHNHNTIITLVTERSEEANIQEQERIAIQHWSDGSEVEGEKSKKMRGDTEVFAEGDYAQYDEEKEEFELF